MRSHALAFMGGALALAVIVLLLGGDPAMAATSQVGQKIGGEVKSLATALFLAVAALVAIPVLTRRDVNGGMVIALLVLMLGGFVFAPGMVKQVIVELWSGLS